MQIRRFAGALVIAAMTAIALHVSAQPAKADTLSACAQFTMIELNIRASGAPAEVQQAAIDILNATKRFFGCEQQS